MANWIWHHTFRFKMIPCDILLQDIHYVALAIGQKNGGLCVMRRNDSSQSNATP